MNDPVITYVIAAVIAAIPTMLSAWLLFKGRKNPSGDAELADRQAYYSSLQERNDKLQTRNDLLEESKILQSEQLIKSNQIVDELTRHGNLLEGEKKELERLVVTLRAEVEIRVNEARKLQTDVVGMNRRIVSLEKQVEVLGGKVSGIVD